MNKKVFSVICVCALGMGIIAFGANAVHGSRQTNASVTATEEEKNIDTVLAGTSTSSTSADEKTVGTLCTAAMESNILLVDWNSLLPTLGTSSNKLIIPGNMEIASSVSKLIPQEEEAGGVLLRSADVFSEGLTEEAQLALNLELAQERLDISNPEIEISAKAALLIDTETMEVLYAKNALDEIAPASTTKLLTAMTALDYCDLDEKVTVGDEITLIASDSSRAYLVQGEVLTMEQCLDAMLLPSGNDAAYTIAAYVGRKLAGDDTIESAEAVSYFIDAMNQKVEELNLVDSHFESPDGYDADGQHTTAYDMGLIGIAALEYDAIRDTVKKTTARDQLVSGQDVTWTNSNKLIKQGSGYYYSYAIGLKTGSSGQAGRCLVSAVNKDGREFVSVVMNASYSGRWQDSVDLLRYAISILEE